ncbi:U11/U12 small nuclear ribonucleoprotein 35 kDa protein-like [Penaeus indicus]|uniref:U11/U12 small nuclear ribonucleoprotein 35 kDa protein-like n=1 Tax=Penaeus indicus TaxID=29960 RepID=UPI00300CB6CF
MPGDWKPIAREYDPLAAGSIDGTDTEPHDRAVWRAMHAHHTPPELSSNSDRTLFVGRLPQNLKEDQLRDRFSRFGVVESIHLVTDIVTGQSKGYGFVEFRRGRDAAEAQRECRGLEIEGRQVIVDWEAGRKMKGWIPRRLGGGWGGRKEAGQLRFGCVDRPWKKPIVINPQQNPADAKGGYAARGNRPAERYTRNRDSPRDARERRTSVPFRREEEPRRRAKPFYQRRDESESRGTGDPRRSQNNADYRD